jgi:hypothetical protein
MQKQSSSEGLLIVLELGAEWPSLQGIDVAPSRRRVLSQDESETPSAFAVRVAEQLDSQLARGASPKNAWLVCNGRLDAPAMSARAELSRAVASAVARAGGGGLLLSASSEEEARGREALAALCAELSKEWQSGAVTAELRFGRDAAPSALATNEAKSRPVPSSRRGKAAGKGGTRRVA